MEKGGYTNPLPHFWNWYNLHIEQFDNTSQNFKFTCSFQPTISPPEIYHSDMILHV